MSSRARLLWLAVALCLALGLRLWRIDSLPPGFHFDEAFEGLEAWRILRDPTYRPLFLPGNFGVLPLNVYANALMFGLFELAGGAPGPTAMRVTAALVGLLTVGTVYLLASELRALDGPQSRLTIAFPLLAAVTLAVMRWHIHFSRMGIEPILTPLLWAAATWLLLRGWRTGHALHYAGGGALVGLAMYAYQAAWVIPLLAAGTGLTLLFTNRETGDSRLEAERGQSPVSNLQSPISSPQSQPVWGLFIAALAAGLTFAPLGWYFWQHPDQFLLRPAQIAVVGEGAAAETTSVWATTGATAKMFGPFGAPGDQDPRRNLPGAPALSPWLALPFYLGLALAVARLRRPAFAILPIGLFGLLLPGVLSEYAPHFHRIVGASAPVALLCAAGLDWLWRARRGPLPQWGLRALVIGLLLLGGVTEARNYFVRWAALPDLYYAFDVGLWQIGERIAALPPDAAVYLTPRPADHPTLAFALQAQHGGAPAPVSFDGRHIFPLTTAPNPQPAYYVVIEHEDFRTPLLLPELFPMAPVVARLVDWQGQAYARIYERPAQTTPQRPPAHPAPFVVGDGIALLGYDLLPASPRAGEVLYLQLHWRVDSAPTGDWTVFTHIVAHDPSGANRLVAGHDSRPGAGSLPTPHWQPGWRILDEYQIPLPGELAAGTYRLEIGLYRPDGARLPADGSNIVLGEVRIE